MSMANCDPAQVEATARRLRESLGVIPSAVQGCEAPLQGRLHELEVEAESIRGELAWLDPDDPEDRARERALRGQLREVERRILVARQVLASLAGAIEQARRIDEHRHRLADRLHMVANHARDVGRGGMPEPSPSRVSAGSAEIDAALRSALAGTGISLGSLVPLPPTGAGEPGNRDRRIEPTDPSRAGERAP
jgi:hypothetical protein